MKGSGVVRHLLTLLCYMWEQYTDHYAMVFSWSVKASRGRLTAEKKLMHRRRWYMLLFWGKGAWSYLKRRTISTQDMGESVQEYMIFGPDCKWRSESWQKDMYCEGKDLGCGNGIRKCKDREMVKAHYWRYRPWSLRCLQSNGAYR